MKRIIFSIILLISCFSGFSQENLGPIKWLTFQEAEKLDSTENRPFLIDVYTDWCGWCKRMMATTFQHKQLAEYINRNFYCIRFNAETEDTIKFLGKTWTSDGRNNRLAVHLLEGRMSYPTIVYMDKKKNIYPVPGYRDVKNIEPLLVYFSEELSDNINPDEFELLYMLKYPEHYKNDLAKIKNAKNDTLGKIQWKTFQEITELSKENPKPIFIDVYIDDKYRGYVPYWSMNASIHEGVVLKDKKLCDYINENFYPVRFEATTLDTIYWFDPLKEHPFVSLGENMPNQFTNALMRDNYKFPAMFFFDNKHNYLSKINDFFSPEFLLLVSKFYATEAYKTQNFEAFYRKNANN
ncbi:MAG: thioredoxin fold domain-containing protein [Bacteroidales bacterium]|nr:thioredoxin fold domain-containing protein [Bacteroidales bacterium]